MRRGILFGNRQLAFFLAPLCLTISLASSPARAAVGGGPRLRSQSEAAELSAFERFALHLRNVMSGREKLVWDDLVPVMQYDNCSWGANCAPEVSPFADPDTYAKAAADRFYGYQMIFLVDKSRSEKAGRERSGSERRPQTLYVYVRDGDGFRFYDSFAISTGREPSPGSMDTHEGYMRVQSADAAYVSRKFGESMPYSLWFESEYGTAIHQTRADWCKSWIGSRRSAGCIRLCPDSKTGDPSQPSDAKLVFDLVTALGRNSPIVLLDRESGHPVTSGVGWQAKVIRGYPVFVRIIDATHSAEKLTEIEELLARPNDPAVGFARYFPPLLPLSK